MADITSAELDELKAEIENLTSTWCQNTTSRLIAAYRELLKNTEQQWGMTTACRCKEPLICCDNQGCRCVICGEAERIEMPSNVPD